MTRKNIERHITVNEETENNKSFGFDNAIKTLLRKDIKNQPFSFALKRDSWANNVFVFLTEKDNFKQLNMNTAENKLIGWYPTQADLLCSDWRIVGIAKPNPDIESKQKFILVKSYK